MIRFRARRWRQEELAKRLGQLIYGRETAWREDGGRWHIGDANDWWLHPQAGDEYVLHYRYADQERLRALAVVLAWLLDVEIIEG